MGDVLHAYRPLGLRLMSYNDYKRVRQILATFPPNGGARRDSPARVSYLDISGRAYLFRLFDRGVTIADSVRSRCCRTPMSRHGRSCNGRA